MPKADSLPGLEPVRLIEPDGLPTRPDRAAAFPPEELKRMYALMTDTRELNEEFVNLQRQGELALFPSCRGQEGAQVGAATALRADDWLFPQYRELGVFLVRGIAPEGIGAMWRGTLHGGAGMAERSCAPMSIPIGTHALHAVGAAMAAVRLGEDTVTVAFLGDGATSEGDVHEAMNFAAVYAAPCVFYIQNNHWAISVPVADQTRAPSIAHKAIGYGMPGVRVDGNDVLACQVVVSEAVAHARAGGGPALIEAVTYRMDPHTTSDDPTRYRAPEDAAEWEERDPLLRLRRYLTYRGLWTDGIEEQAIEHGRQLRSRLRGTLFGAPDPSPLEAFDHVFAHSTSELDSQRAQLSAEFARES